MRAAISKTILGLAAIILWGTSAHPASAGAITYLALGDSLAFGQTQDASVSPSYGDRGYVAGVADVLGAVNGVRPDVINLGISGETTSSFFGGGQYAAPLNLNYANTVTSQNTTLIAKVAEENAAGHTIGSVTVSLGANDLFAVTNSADFLAMSPADQQAALLGAVSKVQNNYTAILTELKTLTPSADIALVGYYNPFPGIPDSPILTVADPAIKLLNAVIAGQAAAFGVRYVDTYTPFLGHESEYTNGVHPNDLGYQVIASAINPVPEPTTMAVLGVLGLGLAGRAARRRHKAA